MDLIEGLPRSLMILLSRPSEVVVDFISLLASGRRHEFEDSSNGRRGWSFDLQST